MSAGSVIGLDVCAACGERLVDWDHHCDPRREKQIEDGRRKFTKYRRPATPSFSSRLDLGFTLNQDDDVEV